MSSRLAVPWLGGPGGLVSGEAGARRFFHFSLETEEIGDFHPLTHFGTCQAALDRSQSHRARARGEGRLYEVELLVHHPLRIPDLHQERHSWMKLVDLLHYSLGVFSPEERASVFQAAAPRGQQAAEGRARLVQLLERKGFDSLVYTNLHEDPGSDSWMNLRSEQVRVRGCFLLKRSSGELPPRLEAVR